ncbi:hypothetical protein ACLOJK_015065, partial [Asimina triloba]
MYTRSCRLVARCSTPPLGRRPEGPLYGELRASGRHSPRPGSHNPHAVQSHYTNSYQKSGSTSSVNKRERHGPLSVRCRSIEIQCSIFPKELSSDPPPTSLRSTYRSRLENRPRRDDQRSIMTAISRPSHTVKSLISDPSATTDESRRASTAGSGDTRQRDRRAGNDEIHRLADE